jgi:hypothetical protein
MFSRSRTSSLRNKRSGSSTLRNSGKNSLGRTTSPYSSSKTRLSSCDTTTTNNNNRTEKFSSTYSSSYNNSSTDRSSLRSSNNRTGRRGRRDTTSKDNIRTSSLSQLFSRKSSISSTNRSSYSNNSNKRRSRITGSSNNNSYYDSEEEEDDDTYSSDNNNDDNTNDILSSRTNKKSSSTTTTCDKCDSKKHSTANCPHYRKKRGSHPDEQKGKGRSIGGGGGNFVLKKAKVVRQPGDGSCLFHSLCYGLSNGTRASTLRREIANFIAKNPRLKIADSPLSDWIKWESNSSVKTYASRMSRGGWGGGIEMAAFSHLYKVNVHVYEKKGGMFSRSSGFRRISCFNVNKNGKTVHILYGGRV